MKVVQSCEKSIKWNAIAPLLSHHSPLDCNYWTFLAAFYTQQCKWYQSLFLVPRFSDFPSGHERGLKISSNRLHSTRIERLQSCSFQNEHLEMRWSHGKPFANRLSVTRIDFADDESNRPVRIMSIRQHWIPQFNAYFCESTFGDGSTLLMTSPVDLCESCRFVNIEYPNLALKKALSSFANRLPARRIDFTNRDLKQLGRQR